MMKGKKEITEQPEITKHTEKTQPIIVSSVLLFPAVP